MPRLLLINPVIHDFAAYDFWARPQGLQMLAGILCDSGATVDYLDLADPLSPWLPEKIKQKRKSGGHGKFTRTKLSRPKLLPDINRRWSRYGLPPENARQALRSFMQPDAVMVTSMMTYWYRGVAETIEWVKEVWPQTAVILGGVYATLLPEHAKENTGAEVVLPGPVENRYDQLNDILGLAITAEILQTSLPLHRPHPHSDSAGLLTSRGCPFQCPYCGVRVLHPGWMKYSAERVEREVRHIVCELGITDLALMDDAFLIDTDRALDILDRIAAIGRPVSIHAASGLSIRGLDEQMARALKCAGFATIRLGLESADPHEQKKLGGKVTGDEFLQAIECLRAAGFTDDQIGVYVMAGMPGQQRDEVEASVEAVLALGLFPHLSEYSPVPGSAMFAKARQSSPFDLQEPLFHNPTLLSCAGNDLSRTAISELKARISRDPRVKKNELSVDRAARCH